MAKHVEQAIREALKAIFEDFADLANVPVYAARSRPLGIAEGSAAIEILSPAETTMRHGSCGASTKYERDIKIIIVGYTSGAGDEAGANARSALRLKIEDCLDQASPDDAEFAGMVTDFYMTGTETALDPSSFPGAAFAMSWTFQSNATLEQMKTL